MNSFDKEFNRMRNLILVFSGVVLVLIIASWAFYSWVIIALLRWLGAA